jgi:NDP-sugar pyrophosphorylase family protein
MQGVILAGGQGTRLRPFTATIPKPLLPLGDIPIVEVVIRQLAASGVRRIAIALGHLAHLFTAVVGDGLRFGVEIRYFPEEHPLGTAGPLRLIPELEEPFLVMNGDVLTTLDYNRLITAHIQSDAAATIAVRQRDVKIDFGVIAATPDGLLEDYLEKPVISYKVSMGISVLSRRCLDLIPEHSKFDMPDLMLALKTRGYVVRALQTDCYWQDIGRVDDYELASADFQRDPSRFLQGADCQ